MALSSYFLWVTGQNPAIALLKIFKIAIFKRTGRLLCKRKNILGLYF